MDAKPFLLRSARFVAAGFFEKALYPGARAIDATMGNGYDTLQLCRLVEEAGHVDAFDVQPQALASTRDLLQKEGLLQRASLHLLSHDLMGKVVTQKVQLVAFNLGWLPGGAKTLTTLVHTTLPALAAAMDLLEIGGLCVVCMYPGHAQGEKEKQAIVEWARQLAPQRFGVLHHQFLNAPSHAPQCVVVEKQAP